jgi:hypothetical protein
MGPKLPTNEEAGTFQYDNLLVDEYIGKLVQPVIDVIRYYPDQEMERRTLFFTWAANLFKPIAPIEVSRILGYDYKKVRNLFVRLTMSSVLVCVDDGLEYCIVGSDQMPIYVRRDVITGRTLLGRPPTRLYVFKERQEINFNDFVALFNQHSNEVWKSAARRIISLAKMLDPLYREALLDDCLFLCDKIRPVLHSLIDSEAVFFKRKKDRVSLVVPLKRASAEFEVPSEEPFERVL